MDVTLSEYEKQRQENVRRNEQMLRSLNLDQSELVQKRKSPLSPTRKEATGKRAKLGERRHQEPVERRRSRRLQGIRPDIDNNRGQRPGKAEPGTARPELEDRVTKIYGRPRQEGDLKLSSVLEQGSIDKFRLVIRDVCRNSGAGDEDGVKSEGEEERPDAQAARDLHKVFGGLSIRQPYNPPLVTEARIYDLDIHPSASSLLIGAGDQNGMLGFWRVPESEWDANVQRRVGPKLEPASTDEVAVPDVFTFTPHTRTISTVRFCPGNSNHLYTASYDGCIRRLDLGKASAFTEAVIAGEDIRIHSLDMDPMGGATPVIYFSTQAGAVGRQDTRERPTRHTMWHLTTEKIGCMALNPAEPHCFVTSSLDRTVRVWDVRGVAAPSGEGNSRTPIEIWRRDEKYSVTASYFHSGGHRMVSTCFDNYIRIFDFSGIVSERAAARRRRSARLSSSSSNGGKNGYDESVQPSVDSMVEIPHNNRSGHWVTLLQAIWNSNPEYPPCFVAGNMDRSAEIFCGTTGAVVAKLKDHSVLPTIPAVNKFHPYLPVVVSANAKGKVVVWS